MIMAYQRPMNLGNLISHRDLATAPPPPPSRHTYMTRDMGGLCMCVCAECVLSVCLVCVLSVCA